MGQRWLSTIARSLRRHRRWFDGGFNYQVAYRKVDLDRDYWKIVGTPTKEEFDSLGLTKLRMLIDLGLTPRGRVLDVGCGTGLLTAALSDYLSPEGLYCGTDIAQEAVDFCRKTYRRPNFSFYQSELIRVPIEGPRFDIIFFGSVFTHIYPTEIRDMLVDVQRLLDPKGLIVADAFVDPSSTLYRGDRGMVVINEAHLHEMLVASGLQHQVLVDAPCNPEAYESYRSWPNGPETRRVLIKLTHAA